ncbi:MAG TPA: hypothetical protein VMW83_11645, partial [Spirochaetia bacterium]|nr:hypothetical protein [Spirochaetia bacterium]
MRVYTFKIYLGGVPKKRPDPPWRKIEIAGSRTLDDLHEAIIDNREEETHLYATETSKSAARGGYLIYEYALTS